MLRAKIAARDLARASQAKVFWIAAAVAFDNAANTRPAASLVEDSSELKPRVMMGDAWLGAGELTRAKTAYVGAVRAFIDQDEPARDLVWLAGAAARWASLLVAQGACKNGSEPGEWHRLWEQLGANSRADPCALKAPIDTVHPSDFGMIGLLYPWVARAINLCGLPAERDGKFDHLELLTCLQQQGPERPEVAREFFKDHTRAGLDRQINIILSTPEPRGSP